MKRLIAVACMATLTASAALAQLVPSWPAATQESKPGARWWWMGSAVDAPNLRWTIGEYARTGLGTLEITPIYGVQGNEQKNISYLSDRWMQMLGTAQETGAAQGVTIDMNGGTGWPFGGPWVPTAEAACKLVTKTEVVESDGATTLSWSVSSPEQNAQLSKVMAYPDGDTEGQPLDLTDHVSDKTLAWQAPAGRWRLLAVYNGRTAQAVKRAAPGGEGLVVDHYDADAVAHYLQHFDERFEATGAQWPHSFFNDSYEVYGADWTPRMFEQFERLRGYRLEDHLHQLLGYAKDTGNQVLADYRQTLSDLLLENFTRQWTRWAHGHGVTTRNQGHGSPGNLLDFYAAVDIPETESFGISPLPISGLRQDPGFTSENLSDIATLKYASSAAHVTGKRLVSSETFTWLAEHFRVSLSQMKPDLDLFFLAGVNHIFFHGTTYSPRDEQWPGWKFYASVDMSPTNSIWRDAPWLMQYAERCQRFLQMGSPDNDLLVYAPFTYAMHQNTGANAARLQLFDINTLSQKLPQMVAAVQAAERAGLDCDFCSDRQLLLTTFDGTCLVTEGGTRYRALVVPVSTYMPADVQQHLSQLEAQGATIVYGTDAAALTATGVEGEALRTQLGLQVLRRSNATGHHYFISNLTAGTIEGRVPLAVDFQSAVLFDPMTGRMRQASVEDGQVWIALRSGESVIMQTYNQPVVLESFDEPLAEGTPFTVGSQWTLSFSADTNSEALDATYALDVPIAWEQLGTAPASLMGTGTYRTTFTLSRRQLDMGNAGFRLLLGDVRESARVYINGEMAGCAWAAPFAVDATGLLREGENELSIEVTNLPANRIAQMDRDGAVWRRFGDVNILDIVGGKTSQSGVRYNDWQLVPSGLNGTPVQLVPLRRLSTELQARFATFDRQGDDFYPVFVLTTPSGQQPAQVTITQDDGSPYNGYTYAEGRLMLTGYSQGLVVVRATDADGQLCETYLQAPGAYEQRYAVDFTSPNPPACGWMDMPSQSTIKGFGGTGALTWHRALANGKLVTTMYDGLTFSSERSCYYFFYPGYGMTASNDFTLSFEARPYELCLLSKLVGEGETVYAAQDSLVDMTTCPAEAQQIALSLGGTSSMTIYRSLQVYRPRHELSAISQPEVSVAASRRSDATVCYTLHGQRVAIPRKGIYVRQGRKVVVR